MLAKFWNRLAFKSWRRGDLGHAEQFFRRSLALREAAATLSNLGALLMERHAFDEGFQCLTRAALLAPSDPGVQVNLANAYHRGGRVDQAFETFRRALEIDPNNMAASVNLMRVALEVCEWGEVASRVSQMKYLRKQDGVSAWDLVTPFNSLFLDFDVAELQEIARRHTSVHYDALPHKFNFLRRSATPKIRLGYLSSDFHDHPTAHLTLALYGLHNRDLFDVYAYSIGYRDRGRHRRRIESDCDVFRDVSDLSDVAVARQIYTDRVDILIDLKGYTGGGRPGVLALRPAPVQVSYLGYPGTMGSTFVDYIIADSVVVPGSDFCSYSERVLWLPNAYQPTDDAQVIGFSPYSRHDYGLPDDCFVFCCFNNSAKIDFSTFSAWMRVLQAVPGSVLWLLNPPDHAKSNIFRQMRLMGVDENRLIFAPVSPKSEHLARIGLADLSLDTFKYNAHTTTTDSLWAGVPVVTKIGGTFASRVAASLLGACGLQDLVAHDDEGFVELAVKFARDNVFREHVRSILRRRRRAPLFDSAGYVRDLDALLVDVWRDRAS